MGLVYIVYLAFMYCLGSICINKIVFFSQKRQRQALHLLKITRRKNLKNEKYFYVNWLASRKKAKCSNGTDIYEFDMQCFLSLHSLQIYLLCPYLSIMR